MEVWPLCNAHDVGKLPTMCCGCLGYDVESCLSHIAVLVTISMLHYHCFGASVWPLEWDCFSVQRHV